MQKPPLKEEPKEWQKFTTVIAVISGAVSVVLRVHHAISQTVFVGALVALSLALLTCMLRPRVFRGFYRGGMTVSFHIGQVMGRILLTLFFLLALTPLGLLLRLLGKDLLKIKRSPDSATYWHPAKANPDFNRQF